MSPLAKFARLRKLLMNDRETLIVLDWDDTLLPTTHLFETAAQTRADDKGTRQTAWNRDELKLAEAHVKALLDKANKLGKVVILTNAKRPWIKKSCQATFPGLVKQVCRVEHVYAEDCAPQVPLDLDAFPRLAKLKQLALEKLLHQPMYRQLVSLGDGEPELFACQALAAQRPQLKVKAVKLADNPTTAVLTEQLAALAENLGALVLHENGYVCDAAGKPLAQHHGDYVCDAKPLVPASCGASCGASALMKEAVPYPLTKEAVASKAVL